MDRTRRFVCLACLVVLVLAPALTVWARGGTDAAAAGTDKFVELSLYYPSVPQKDGDVVQAAVNDLLKKKLNCSLAIKPIDWGQWDQKYPLLLASGEKIDLIFTASWSGYYQEVAKNSYLPLDDLLARYGKDIPKNMQDGYLQAARVKGKTYGIPVNKEMGTGYGVLVDREMADSIGVDLKNVRYLEDLEPALQAAKQKLPGVTPFYLSTDDDMRELPGATRAAAGIGLLDHSSIVMLDDQIAYNVKTNKALPLYDIPEYVDQARLVRKWFQAGYINQDVVTTETTANDASRNGKVFARVGAQSPIHLKVYEGVTGRKQYTIQLLPGIKETAGLTGAMTAIGRTSANPERSMAVINLLFADKDLKNLITYGIEGKHYVRNGNIIKLPAGAASAEDTGYNPDNWWELGNAMNLYVWDYEDANKWDLLKTFGKTLPVSGLLGFSFEATPVMTEVATHKNVMTEFYRLLANGAADPDQTVKSMRDKDALAGIAKITAAIESQVKEWKAGR